MIKLDVFKLSQALSNKSLKIKELSTKALIELVELKAEIEKETTLLGNAEQELISSFKLEKDKAVPAELLTKLKELQNAESKVKVKRFLSADEAKSLVEDTDLTTAQTIIFNLVSK